MHKEGKRLRSQAAFFEIELDLSPEGVEQLLRQRIGLGFDLLFDLMEDLQVSLKAGWLVEPAQLVAFLGVAAQALEKPRDLTVARHHHRPHCPSANSLIGKARQIVADTARRLVRILQQALFATGVAVDDARQRALEAGKALFPGAGEPLANRLNRSAQGESAEAASCSEPRIFAGRPPGNRGQERDRIASPAGRGSDDDRSWYSTTIVVTGGLPAAVAGS